MANRERSWLVELPESEVEVRGESDPESIREEEPCGEEGERQEGDDGGDDHGEEQEDFGTSGADAMKAEEEDGPDRIENKLNGEQEECRTGSGPAGAAPDEPGTEGHHQVERGPDRGEDPVGRSPGRTMEGRVPGPDRASGGYGPDGGSGEAGENEGEQREPGLAIKHWIP